MRGSTAVQDQGGMATKLRRNSARGFSLLELLFVMAIATIITVMSVPYIQAAYDGYKLNAAVNAMTGAIQVTRYKAISLGYPSQIVFTKATSQYQAMKDPENDGTFAVDCVNNASTCPVPFTTSAMLGTDTTLTFSPGGRVTSPLADVNGVTTMTMTYKTKTETITISPFGRANVTP